MFSPPPGLGEITEQIGNKFGNISKNDAEDDMQVVDLLARPEGFEPPTLRSEV